VFYHNGAQRYEQFLRVSQLYWALILLGLSLSSEHLCIFSLHGAMYIVIFLVTPFSLPFSELSMVRLALDMVN